MANFDNEGVIERFTPPVPEISRSLGGDTIHCRYLLLTLRASVNAPKPSFDGEPDLVSSGYRITVDNGRDSFFAICIEEPDSETAWIMSDTVRSLERMR